MWCFVLVCLQIGDFGMSRNLADETYYKSHGGKIPFKWSSPEVRICQCTSQARNAPLEVCSFLCRSEWPVFCLPYQLHANKALRGRCWHCQLQLWLTPSLISLVSSHFAGSAVSQVLLSQWCVELWGRAVWNLFSRQEAVFRQDAW